jgi:hypothetical protein
MIEDLLSDLASSGWTLSWAFQYAPSEWRVSIIHQDDIGRQWDQPSIYLSHCASAPTFAEALEDAMLRRNEAEFMQGHDNTYGGMALAPAPTNLLQALGLVKPMKIDRRI